MNNNYVTYHLHSDRSLLDSCTNYKDYIDHAVELGQKAICFSEHGRILSWVAKKLYCTEKGIRYIHGVECYLTESLTEKVRDNYHTVLIARNYDGVKEINTLLSRSEQPDHFYYKNRITFDEFLATSDNIISTSACLASPLNKLAYDNPYYEKLAQKYTYYEIQPHNHPDQIAYNQRLLSMAVEYNKPLIAGTDTHSLNKYKAECRGILQAAKHISYSDEDSFDLTYKSYDELVESFSRQGAVDKEIYMDAIENTNRMAEMVEDFNLDTSFKYPILYGSYEQDIEMYAKRVSDKFAEKVNNGIITAEQVDSFQKKIAEETRVFEKINMCGFMLSMSEFVCWCKDNGIPVGFNRGSCGGSRVAYVLDITDMNPETWHTIFSRFANEDRKEIGDIDIDISPDDRDKMYGYIIERFGGDNAAFILAIGTISSKGTIDEIGRALAMRWEFNHEGVNAKNNPFSLSVMKDVKDLFEVDENAARKKYPDLFYYYDGLVNTAISQSMHPAGMVVSPVSLPDNYGYLVKDGKSILQIDMEEIHELSLVKYDILGLKNIQVIRDCCKLAGIPYPKSHEIDWNDETVWEDMLRCPAGIFQFEGDFAYTSLKKMKPKNIFDMSLVTAAIRPSGSSYRDDLLQRKNHKNPSSIIDDMLADNYGHLVYQEDVIKFLQEVCGLSGSDADNVRRAIGRKDEERLKAALPDILEGYCAKSDKPREEAEKEAQTFIKIIEDSSSYMFGYNHSIGYCLI
jgi:DNA polymerase III subunit alpha